MINTLFSKIFAAFILCFFVITSCSKSSSSSNNQCSFSTTSGTAQNGSQVTYSAIGKGATSLSSVSYQGASGLVNVSNPSLPWSASVNLPNGGQVGLSAVGTASNGGIITLAWNINASGNFQADSTSCGH